MKQVFQNHSQVCHAFNLQNQQRGRAGSIFFEGNRIYSYGYHYLMGEFIDNETILINDKGYSNSTAKHISILGQATRDKKQIYLSHIELDLVLNELESLYKSLLVARKPERYYNSIVWLSNNFNHNTSNLKGFYLENKYYEGFQFIPINGTKNWKQLTKEHKEKLSRINEIFSLSVVYSNSQKYLEKVERAKELEATKQQRAKEKREKQRVEQIENFYSYKGSRINYLEFDLLRLSKCGEFVETSQAVRIPLKEAQRYFRLFKSGSKLVGEKIGQFTTISNDGFLKIGCHKIEHKEANRIGNLITQ
jgi:hypothetical protein